MDAMATQQLTRRMLALAIPALGALIAQPLFVATDTAMVGHLGEPVLAGLAVGSTVVTTLVGLMVFLAYTTTPMVARRLGAGDKPGAVRAGIDGMWLGLGCGVVLLLIGLPLASPIVAGFTQDALVADAAMSYLTISLWGLPGMLLTLAATGLLRGLQDTRTPLIVSVAGALANVLLNAVFIYGLNLGIALGVLVTVTSGVLGFIFTTDARVLDLLPGAIATMAATLPLCGFVFALDGVLIGAGDIAYLAWVGLINLAVFAVCVWLVLTIVPGEGGLYWLWATYGGGFMLSRGATLAVRVAGNRWIVTGASR
jgi:Na+-driven multidrug efflux pump